MVLDYQSRKKIITELLYDNGGGGVLTLSGEDGEHKSRMYSESAVLRLLDAALVRGMNNRVSLGFDKNDMKYALQNVCDIAGVTL